MSVELQKKIDELGQVVTQFKEANDSRFKELEKKGSASALAEEKVNKANDDITRLQAEIKALEAGREEMKTAFNRLAQGEGSRQAEETGDSKELKSAFNKFLRKGEQKLSDVELKAMSVDSDPDGGYLVRPELAAGIVTRVFETSPIRQVADQVSISTDILDIYEDPNEVSAAWVSERGTRSATNTSQLNLGKISTEELYANPQVTQKLLDDANFDVEKWLMGKIADKISRLENTAFVAGTGVGQPRGFTTYASGTTWGQIEQKNSGSAGAVTADGVIDTCYALKAHFVQNASWIMARATEAAVRKLKDSQNRYLWEPSLQAGRPPQLLGHPIYWGSDMPAIASAALAIAFGDFKQGYRIVDRIGIRILRDPFTSKPNVLFYTTKRTGGAVVNFDAIKLNKLT